jgi:hypothetical protein
VRERERERGRFIMIGWPCISVKIVNFRACTDNVLAETVIKRVRRPRLSFERL